MVDINYLNDERQKIWQEVNSLKAAMHQISGGDTEISKKIENLYKKISDYDNKMGQILKSAEKEQSNLVKTHNQLKSYTNNLTDNIRQFNSNYKKSNLRATQIDTNLVKINKIHTTYKKDIQNLKNEISNFIKTKNRLLEIEKNCIKSEKNIYNSEDEIKEIHFKLSNLEKKIFGYSEKLKNGEIIEKTGVVHKLESSYSTLEKKYATFSKDFEIITNEATEKTNKLLEEKKQEFELLFSEIEALLPGALSTGLSKAYHDKRTEEEKEKTTCERNFYIAVLCLVVVSTIPFILGLYMYYGQNIDLKEIIMDTPRIVCATIPLYAPILWVAFFANRKANLSKRLIEEYTHKETISKTFQGLSKQIAELPSNDISENLKIKLLYNIVSMNSENPGKLIKGYNKPDHPVLDLIDKSTGLSQAIEKAFSLPGIGGIIQQITGNLNISDKDATKNS